MTTAVLSPLRKQGDVSKDPTAPTAIPPIVHLGPLLTSIKGRSRALVREGGRAGERADAQGSRSLSLSPSRTLVTPYCKCIHPGRRTTRGRGFPLLFSPLCSVSCRPVWAGTRSDNLLVGPGTPRGRNADTTTTPHVCLCQYLLQ
jgi:hypothetical protein